MTKSRKQFRPTWDSIRHYVDGQLVRERSRNRREIEQAISKEAKRCSKQVKELVDCAEATALALNELIERVGE